MTTIDKLMREKGGQSAIRLTPDTHTKPEKNTVWMWGYAYEVPPSDVVYKTREACEKAVRDEEDGEIPSWIWIREFEVVE